MKPDIKALLKQRILVIDGAMGTMIQRYKLSEADYRGERFANFHRDVKGNNDLRVHWWGRPHGICKRVPKGVRKTPPPPLLPLAFALLPERKKLRKRHKQKMRTVTPPLTLSVRSLKSKMTMTMGNLSTLSLSLSLSLFYIFSPFPLFTSTFFLSFLLFVK